MLARIALAHDPPLMRPEQIGQGRAAQVDDEIPAGRNNPAVEREPMPGPALLRQRNERLKSRHRLEERRRGRAGRNGEVRPRMVLDDVGEKPGREDRVTNPRRRDEEYLHRAPEGCSGRKGLQYRPAGQVMRRFIGPAPALAKPSPAPYL